MNGYQYNPPPTAAQLAVHADTVVEAATTEDVRPNAQTFASEANTVIADWTVPEGFVTWQNSRIQVGTTVQVTGLTTRVRIGIIATRAGEVDISRSSGSEDEAFQAQIGGTPS